jgi:signal transduction histidine kinase
MGIRKPKQAREKTPQTKRAEDFRALSRQILRRANRNAPRVDFLKEVFMMLMKFSGCDAMELWLKEEEDYFRCRTVLCMAGCQHFQVLPSLTYGKTKGVAHSRFEVNVAQLGWDIIRRRFDDSSPAFTENGSYWTGDASKETPLLGSPPEEGLTDRSGEGGDYRSLALIPLNISNLNVGLIQLKSRRKNFFKKTEIELYEDIFEILAVTLLNQRARAAWRERVKELTCLFGIAKAAEQPDTTLGVVLQSVAELLPHAWQYPEITSGRVIVDGYAYQTPGFLDGNQKQSADIVVKEKKRGVVEILYSENKPELDEGPFLKEERNLINTIATQVSMIIERKEAEEDKERLENQLRHADRLATLGQLAAGVAHELNEPLGSILGFAQLAQKGSALPDETRRDLEKIIEASLHTREIVNKLKLFARQSPPQKTKLDVNQLVEDGLTFLASRCTKAGIELVHSLAPNLPEITADKGQLHQVLVNLVVNSIQAMPDGGKLIIKTEATAKHVSLVVIDTGVGMSEEIRKKIFIPFFTTKDVNEGTGLGLAVVDGIVSSHGGSMKVESEVGSGTRFTVQLPITEPRNSGGE